MDGLDWAVFGAGSAAGAVHVYYADILVEYYAARLGAVLLLNRDGENGTCGAYLTAKVAVIVAVTLVKLHYGLHYST